MDPVTAPFLLLFLGALGLDLGLFGNNDDEAQDAAPAETDAETDADEAGPVAEPGNFDATLYADVVTGTEGDDDLSTEQEDALAWFLQDGNDTLVGSVADDYVEGGAGNDDLSMQDGRDLAYGGEGDDTIDAGIGFDTVFGGAGNDQLTGNGGNDILNGDDGNDELRGGSGADALFGGAGDDVLYGLSAGLSSAAQATEIDGVDSLSGGDGNDRLILGPGDIGAGGAGDDLFQFDYTRPDLEGVVQVTDYTAGDQMDVQYEPQFDADGAEILPIITVVQNAANTGALVMFNDTAIANVIGGQGVLASQITLSPQ